MWTHWCATLICAALAFVSPFRTDALDSPLPTLEIRPISPEAQGSIKIGDRVRFEIVGGANLIRSLKSEPVSLKDVEPKEAATETETQKTAKPYALVRTVPLEPSGEFTAEIVPVKSGSIEVGPFEILQSDQSVAKTGVFKLTVEPNPKSETPPPEILGPVRVGLPWLAMIALALGVLALIIAVMVWIMRRLRKTKAVERTPVVPPEPEDIRVIRVLQQLIQEELWRKGQFKKHYFGVSDAIKEYFGARYGFDGAQATSHELLSQLRKCEVSEDLISELHAAYQLMDRVKFTDHVPTEVESKELPLKALAWVERTRRKFESVAS